MPWDSKDTAMTIQGFGSIASAWGQYETDKQKNKLAKEQLDYEKQKDLAMNTKMDLAQSNLDDAFSNSALNKKKKFNADGTPVVDTTTPII
jgi:hypothetical protein